LVALLRPLSDGAAPRTPRGGSAGTPRAPVRRRGARIVARLHLASASDALGGASGRKRRFHCCSSMTPERPAPAASAPPPYFEGLVDLELHLLDIERLLHVVEGADAHRFDRRLDGPERGHQNDRVRCLQRLRRAGSRDSQGVQRLCQKEDMKSLTDFKIVIPGLQQPAGAPPTAP